MPGVQDEPELDIKPDRPIKHIPEETIQKMYATRLSDDSKAQVHAVWETFTGTKKYHNYTKEIKPTEAAAMRYMMKMTANEYMYVNQDTF